MTGGLSKIERGSQSKRSGERGSVTASQDFPGMI